jgi:hypothetical protein
MTITQMDEKTEYEFVIPSLTRDKQPISHERRIEYINTIQARSLEKNGGFTIIPNCKGGYLSETGDMMYEEVSLIKTHGENPLSEKELEAFADYLYQECLFVSVAGESIAYLHSGRPKISNFSIIDKHTDGSSIEYSMNVDNDGERYVDVMYYDEDGLTNAWESLYEADIESLVESSNGALSRVIDEFYKSA